MTAIPSIALTEPTWTHYAALTLCVLLISSAQTLLKTGATDKRTYLASFINPVTMSGYALFGANSVLAVYAMQVIDLKVCTAWVSVSYLLVMALARLFLKEPISWRKVAGAGLIVCGIAVFQIS